VHRAGYNKVATRTDAKGQQVVYTYDSLARLIEVQRYPQGQSHSEDTCQREDYSYDSNPYLSGFSQNAAGRLAAVQYKGGYNAGSGNCNTTFTEMYSYNTGGAPVAKRVRTTRTLNSTAYYTDLEADYTYDNEGRTTAVQYPSSTANSNGTLVTTAGPDLGTTYDTMGRPLTLTNLANNSRIISAASYGPSSQLLSITGQVSETRTYNSMLQLLTLSSSNSSGGAVNFTYGYSGTQNNGKILSQTDNISGEEVVYTYDALNRLLTATATNNSWGQSYSYDGFGNLTGQTVTAGSAPAYSVVYNAATNTQTTDCADANGNLNSASSCTGATTIYDVENRLISPSSANQWQYSYAP